MNLPAYYIGLFNAVTDALEAMDRQNYGLAREILIKAQQDAEDKVLDEEGG